MKQENVIVGGISRLKINKSQILWGDKMRNMSKKTRKRYDRWKAFRYGDYIYWKTRKGGIEYNFVTNKFYKGCIY